MFGIPSVALGVVAENWMSGTPGELGTDLGAAPGTTNTKSTTVACIGTGIAQPAYAIQIDIAHTNTAGSDTSTLMDIMYDPAGGTSWQVLIPNLICGFRARHNAATAISMNPYWFPLYIPRGSSLGARFQTSFTGAAGYRPQPSITLFGGLSKPGFWFGTKVTTVGAVDSGDSAGVDLNPGSTGTYSAWTNIGGTSNPAFKFLTIGAQGSAATHTADIYHVQYGFNSTQIPGAQIRFGYTANEDMASYPKHRGCFVDIPAGTQLQARATGSDATSEDPSVVLYGVS